MSLARKWLEHPLTRGLSIDDPRVTLLRREIVQSKPLLRDIYLEWYRLIRDSLPSGEGAVLELGSGAGFLRDIVPDVVTSDVFACPGVDLVTDARHLPFRDDELRAIAMVDVLHHISDCRRFFAESARSVRPGGAIVSIEPWVSSWSRFVYGKLHHEPFCPDAREWAFPSSGPLSGANQALPWILFQRDRSLFEQEFPQWKIARVRPMMPFQYLLSGGVGLRSLAPGWAGPLVARVERLASPYMGRLAMFVHLVLARTTVPASTVVGPKLI